MTSKRDTHNFVRLVNTFSGWGREKGKLCIVEIYLHQKHRFGTVNLNFISRDPTLN